MPKVNLPTFFAMWAETQRWEVPDIHWRALHWLENCGDLAVLRCFRGFGKSTILAIYNAWRYYQNPSYRILHQGDQDKTAFKTSRDTRAILARHPLTRDGLEAVRGQVSFWWVAGATDERNPSMQAAGITSNITSSRCDEAQNDDVEVPKNIQNPEARDKMRYRLGEQTHCLVPNGRKLFVGTPHTHDSLYDAMERMGADCLTIKMFGKEQRIERAGKKEYPLHFVPDMVFAGVGEHTKLLREGHDYSIKNDTLYLQSAPDIVLDLYAIPAWPERFTPQDMLKRRKQCKTLNEWDSQYQLHSRPLHEVRLDPALIQPYADEPRFATANKVLTMWLGGVQIVGCSLRWDPSSGKVDSDVSACVLDFQDAAGRHYWHRVQALTGDMATTTPNGQRITGGQVFQLCDLVERYRVPRISIETNGIGQLAPNFMRMALKQRSLSCAVVEIQAVINKNKRILEALEPLVQSGMLWAHVDVLNGALWDQMKEWNPSHQRQKDDYLDAGAGAVTDQPARIGQKMPVNLNATMHDDWRPDASLHEAIVEYSH